MKSEMPCLGVKTPVMRRAVREVFAALPLEDFDAWRDTTLALWRGARYREERYAAIELTGDRAYVEYQTLASLPLYEEIVVTGAWWDYVDAVATQRLFEILKRQPAAMKRRMRAWSKSPDIWKRRCSILFQLKAKRDTDLPLLYECIERSMDEPEFFLRKAIGWALREYAKTDPREVERFVRRHTGRLSPLSQREALKHHR